MATGPLLDALRPKVVLSVERAAALLRRGVDLGLIDSPAGIVDANVDAIPLATHLDVVELLREIAVRALG